MKYFKTYRCNHELFERYCIETIKRAKVPINIPQLMTRIDSHAFTSFLPHEKKDRAKQYRKIYMVLQKGLKSKEIVRKGNGFYSKS